MRTKLVKERGRLILEVGKSKRILMKDGYTLCKLTTYNCTIRALKKASEEVIKCTDYTIISVIDKNKFEKIKKDHGLNIRGSDTAWT